MEMNSRAAACGLIGRFFAAPLLAVFLAMGGAGTAAGESAEAGLGDGAYFGLFASGARSTNEIVDVTGFANWGTAGHKTSFRGQKLVGSALVGRSFVSDGMPLRMELDASFGSIAGKSDRLDPADRDETGKVEYRWIASARVGIERKIRNATAFITGGMAFANTRKSITDIDFSDSAPSAVDPDDSFSSSDTDLGWAVSLGIEAPMADGWSVRLESLYMNFGSSMHNVNHSGDGRCGPGNERMPCPFRFDSDVAMVRIGFVKALDW